MQPALSVAHKCPHNTIDMPPNSTPCTLPYTTPTPQIQIQIQTNPLYTFSPFPPRLFGSSHALPQTTSPSLNAQKYTPTPTR